MNPLGDYTEDYATLNFKFFTATAAGVPTTLLGSPVVSVYKADNVAQSVAGVSLTVDFDGLTGLNNVLIDLSSNSFYETGEDYSVVITTGTVDGVSWVGRVVAEFSIENREGTTDKIWDEALTGATHNVGSSAGKRLRQTTDIVVSSGTAQGPGGNGNQIQLAAGEPAVSDIFDPSVILLTAGTGAGQSRRVIEYDGTTKIAAVSRTWKTEPDATTEYSIFADPGGLHVNEGLAQSGANSTITLNALASDADDAYNGQTVFVVSGTGEDQSRIVTDYDGTSKVATVDRAWDTNPDDTSGYLMLPMMTVTTTEMVTDILAATPTAGGSTTIQDILIGGFALARGRVTKSGNAYTYYDDDGVTALFTLTIAESERTTA